MSRNPIGPTRGWSWRIAAGLLAAFLLLAAAVGRANPAGARRPLDPPQATLASAGAHPGEGRPADTPIATPTSTPTIACTVDGFGPAVNYPVAPGPNSIVVADFNGDTYADLAVASAISDSISVLLGDGNGVFQPRPPVPIGRNMSSTNIAVGDFNEDGRADLALADGSGSDIGIMLGNGDGTFQPGVFYPGGGQHPLSVAVGDFNRDGHPDLALANNQTNDASILLGNGNGTFGPPTTYPAGTTPTGITAGDFNEDGSPDLAVADAADNISILLGNGAGTFRPALNFSDRTNPVAITVADFNGDHHEDLATANTGTRDGVVLLGNGDGTFQPQQHTTTVVYPVSLAPGDFNGDTRTDLAFSISLEDRVATRIGLGDGDFTYGTENLVGASPNSIVAGDFNGDARPDLAVANGTSNTVSVLLNICTSGGATPTPFATRSVTPSPPPSSNTPASTATHATATHVSTSTPTTASATATPFITSTPPPSTNTPASTNTPTPQPTQTPGGPTATPIPSNTPPAVTATPTVCTLQFTDVLPGSTFYPYVQCMACRGIVNGYTSGCRSGNPCFRPGSDVTRGQLSKIVSNSAGFNDPPGAQMFEDVLPGSTFYDYIQRLASRGYINGYPCGGPGEPCQPTNLPYFRTDNNATRGQISKIDANAAGFSDPPAGQQFEDVAVGSTFYTYTYRLVSRGVMSGYPCGGAGEPCVPPGNLPYFRPSNNANRGQTSKIVSNTFFPDCSLAR